MRRFATITAAVVALLLMAPLAPVGATPPSGVEITVPGFDGPFVAAGSAVDDGVICGTGDVATTFVKAAGFQSGHGVNLKVGKEFTCDDGSGTFAAKLQVRIDFETGVTFNWVITDGTGAYEDLHGSGRGFVVPVDTDVYVGGLHID